MCAWGEAERGLLSATACREGGIESLRRLQSSPDLSAVRHVCLVCSHECVHLTPALCKFILEDSNRVWEKAALACRLWASDWLHKGLQVRNQADLPRKELEAVAWVMHVIPDEISDLQWLFSALEHWELLNCFRCWNSYLQITTAILALRCVFRSFFLQL